MGTATGQRILVVDDDPFVLESIGWILEPAGYDLHKVDTAEKALSLLDNGKFDLVLTDYSMPKMRGDELAERVKEKMPGLPVVLMTAYAEMLQCSLSPVVGIDVIVCKPFLAGNLRETIAKYLRKKGS